MSATAISTRWTSAPQSKQNHSNPSLSPGPRALSTTSPTEPAIGRCGEWRMCGGSRKTSPSRIGTSWIRPRFGELQHHVAAQLVKKLLARVVVKVDPLVRAADDLHDHAGVLEHQFVADRRLQQMAMRVDPSRKVERPARARYRHRTSPAGSQPMARRRKL